MMIDMKEINYKDMKFNPFNLFGDEWMLVTAGNEQKCNTMTVSWGHLGCLWGHNDPTAVVYLRQSRYTSTSTMPRVTSIRCMSARLRRYWPGMMSILGRQ